MPVKELLALTGYIRGGVTVLGAKKAFPVFADETIQLWDAISISAGVRGTQMILRPALAYEQKVIAKNKTGGNLDQITRRAG